MRRSAQGDTTIDMEGMTKEARRRRLILLARLLSALTVLGVAAGLWLSIVDQGATDQGLLVAFALFPIVGYLMATRRPDNSLSWIMLGIGVSIGVGGFLGSYEGYAVHGGIGGRTFGLIAVSLNAPMWLPVVGLPVTFLLLLFPDGHLPSPRWRWFARILAVSLVVVYLVIVLTPGKFGDENELGLLLRTLERHLSAATFVPRMGKSSLRAAIYSGVLQRREPKSPD